MGRGSGWVSVSLPPAPIRRQTPEGRARTAAEFEAFTAAAIDRRDQWEKRKAAMTPEAREAKAARDYVHWLRRQLRRAADATRWERVTAALEAHAWERDEAKRKADELRERVRNRTADTYKRAAAGCLTCAAYLADDSTDALYAEAFNDPAG